MQAFHHPLGTPMALPITVVIAGTNAIAVTPVPPARSALLAVIGTPQLTAVRQIHLAVQIIRHKGTVQIAQRSIGITRRLRPAASAIETVILVIRQIARIVARGIG